MLIFIEDPIDHGSTVRVAYSAELVRDRGDVIGGVLPTIGKDALDYLVRLVYVSGRYSSFPSAFDLAYRERRKIIR